MKNKRKLLIIIMGVAALLVILLVAAKNISGTTKNVGDLLSTGQKYLEDMDYERALAAFEELIALEPKNADAYIGLVNTYIELRDYEKALECARKGFELTQDPRLQEKISMLESGNIVNYQGKPYKTTAYDAQGNLLWWHEFQYERTNTDVTSYDAQGTVTAVLHLEESDTVKDSYVYYENGVVSLRRAYLEDGIVVKAESYNTDGQLRDYDIYEYENGLKYKESTYGLDGTLRRYRIYTYGPGNRVDSLNDYEIVDGTEKLLSRQSYEYDSKGQVTKYSYYNGENQLKRYILYEYDANGKKLSSTEYNEAGEVKQVQTYH